MSDRWSGYDPLLRGRLGTGFDPDLGAPWFTDADLAEQEVLVRELVDGYFEHRESCPDCSQGNSGLCRPFKNAIYVVLHWREDRSARSFATAMRALEDLTLGPPAR